MIYKMYEEWLKILLTNKYMAHYINTPHLYTSLELHVSGFRRCALRGEKWEKKLSVTFLNCEKIRLKQNFLIFWLKNELKAKKSDAEIVSWEIKKKKKTDRKTGRRKDRLTETVWWKIRVKKRCAPIKWLL